MAIFIVYGKMGVYGSFSTIEKADECRDRVMNELWDMGDIDPRVDIVCSFVDLER